MAEACARRFKKPSKGKEREGPTKVLYVAGVGSKYETKEETLVSIFSKFGRLCEVVMPVGYRFVYVVFEDAADAQVCSDALSEKDLSAEGLSSSMYIRYAVEVDKSDEVVSSVPPPPECTSTTDHVVVPGLRVVEGFLSVAEESTWMAGVDGKEELSPEEWSPAAWAMVLSRRVQHYGFPFNYHTLLLDYAAVTPPVPKNCRDILQRLTGATADDGLPLLSVQDMPITQLTVNEYEPGQGIAGHVDSKACFGPIVLIVSCGAGITMTLQKRVEPSAACVLPNGTRKYVYLPPRSLMVLQGAARNDWSHAIATRTRDQTAGHIVERGTRVSFTFRQALALGEAPRGVLADSELEKEHVFRVYDHIAQHWHHTRGKRKVYWERVKIFLESLEKGSLLADVGSGDGKYLELNPDVFTVGCDRSLRLLEVSRQPHHELFCSDAVKLPLRDGVFDAAICIAVLHHLASVDRRVAVLKELLRIVRPGGRIMVQTWAKEQEEGSKRQFDEQDVMVPWRLNTKFIERDAASRDGVMSAPQHMVTERGMLTYQRYCHVYKEGELENLCRSIPGCRLVDRGFDRGNWFIELERVQDDRLSAYDVSVPMAFPAFTPRSLKPK